MSKNDIIKQLLFGTAPRTGFGASIFEGVPAALDTFDQRPKGFGALFENVPNALSDLTKTLSGLKAPDVMGGTHHPTNSKPAFDMRAAAMKAIAAQYGPALGVITDAIHDTKREGRKDKRSIRRQGHRAEGDLAILYKRLRQSVGDTQRAQGQDYRRAIQNTKGNFRDIIKGGEEDFSQGAQGVASELERLGIDPTEALAGAARDRAFNTDFAREDRANTVGNLRRSKNDFGAIMGQMKNDVIATGDAAIGAQRGETRDLMSQAASAIADKLFQLRLQRGELSGQQAAAQSAAEMQFAQGAQGMTPEDRADIQYKRAQTAKILAELNGQGGAPTSGNGVGDALNFINSQASSPEMAGNLGKILNSALQGHDAFTKGNYNGTGEPNQGFQFRTEDYGQILDYALSNARVRGATPQDLQAIQAAIQMALGMYS